VTNPKFFDGLAADEKKAFTAACTSADEWLRQYTQKDELEAYDFLKAQGMQVNTSVDVASFRAAVGPVIDKFPDLFEPALVKLAQSTPA
jgi:TRAP-type C4-dicarboxylate transport system substrate-binding protein